MKRRRLSLTIDGREFKLDVNECNAIERVKGLMFSSVNAVPLLFSFRRLTDLSIHSCFVFFDFVAVWLNGNNEVVDVELVKPFRLSVIPTEKYRKLVEIPVNSGNLEIIKFLVGNRKV